MASGSGSGSCAQLVWFCGVVAVAVVVVVVPVLGADSREGKANAVFFDFRAGTFAGMCCSFNDGVTRGQFTHAATSRRLECVSAPSQAPTAARDKFRCAARQQAPSSLALSSGVFACALANACV